MHSQRKYSTIIAGGYGINKVLKSKNIPTITTSDIDMHIVPFKKNLSPMQKQQFVDEFLLEFSKFGKLNRQDFKYRRTHWPSPKRMDVFRDYIWYSLFQINYKGRDIFDFAFTNEDTSVIHKTYFNKTGIPVKQTKYYIFEMLSIISRESIPGLNIYARRGRNPINGTLKQKGEKDIKRLRQLCKIYKSKYCRIITLLKNYKKYSRARNYGRNLRTEFAKLGMFF